MWTLHRSITELRTIDWEVRKAQGGARGQAPVWLDVPPLSAKREGPRKEGLRAVEDEYKVIKVTPVLKLYTNRDSTMQMFRDFEENAECRGHQSLVKDGKTFAEELGFTLNYPESKCINNQGEVFSDRSLTDQKVTKECTNQGER